MNQLEDLQKTVEDSETKIDAFKKEIISLNQQKQR
jgi:hypothetical protein